MMQNGFLTITILFLCMQRIKLFGDRIFCHEQKKFPPDIQTRTMTREEFGLQQLCLQNLVQTLFYTKLKFHQEEKSFRLLADFGLAVKKLLKNGKQTIEFGLEKTETRLQEKKLSYRKYKMV